MTLVQTRMYTNFISCAIQTCLVTKPRASLEFRMQILKTRHNFCTLSIGVAQSYPLHYVSAN